MQQRLELASLLLLRQLDLLAHQLVVDTAPHVAEHTDRGRAARVARQPAEPIERLIDDTEDYMLAVASAKASRRTYSSDEVRRLAGVDD